MLTADVWETAALIVLTAVTDVTVAETDTRIVDDVIVVFTVELLSLGDVVAVVVTLPVADAVASLLWDGWWANDDVDRLVVVTPPAAWQFFESITRTCCC